MAATQKIAALVADVEEVDLDIDTLAVSQHYTVMRGRTWAIATGRTSHYDKVTIVEQILAGETEQEFRDRVTLLINREASAEKLAMDNWLEEVGL